MRRPSISLCNGPAVLQLSDFPFHNHDPHQKRPKFVSFAWQAAFSRPPEYPNSRKPFQPRFSSQRTQPSLLVGKTRTTRDQAAATPEAAVCPASPR